MLSTKEGSNNRDQLGGSWYEVPCWWENNVLQYYPVPPFLCRLVDGFVFSKKRNSYQLSTCPLRPKYSTLVLEVFVTWGRILLSKKKHGHWRHWWFRWKILRLQQSVRIFSWTSTYRPTSYQIFVGGINKPQLKTLPFYLDQHFF